MTQDYSETQERLAHAAATQNQDRDFIEEIQAAVDQCQEAQNLKEECEKARILASNTADEKKAAHDESK